MVLTCVNCGEEFGNPPGGGGWEDKPALVIVSLPCHKVNVARLQYSITESPSQTSADFEFDYMHPLSATKNAQSGFGILACRPFIKVKVLDIRP